MQSKTLQHINTNVLNMLSIIQNDDSVDYYKKVKALEMALTSLAGFLEGVDIAASEIYRDSKETLLDEGGVHEPRQPFIIPI